MPNRNDVADAEMAANFSRVVSQIVIDSDGELPDQRQAWVEAQVKQVFP
jgi:hypothetical protein